jgi:hypothetical protein
MTLVSVRTARGSTSHPSMAATPAATMASLRRVASFFDPGQRPPVFFPRTVFCGWSAIGAASSDGLAPRRARRGGRSAGCAG